MDGNPKIEKMWRRVGPNGAAGLAARNENGEYYDLVLSGGAFYFLKRGTYTHDSLPPDIRLYNFNKEVFAESIQEIREYTAEARKWEKQDN